MKTNVLNLLFRREKLVKDLWFGSNESKPRVFIEKRDVNVEHGRFVITRETDRNPIVRNFGSRPRIDKVCQDMKICWLKDLLLGSDQLNESVSCGKQRVSLFFGVRFRKTCQHKQIKGDKELKR